MSTATEQAVEELAGLLESLSRQDVVRTESELLKALPCSFAGVTSWLNRMPNPDVQQVLARLDDLRPFLEQLGNADLSGFSALVNADPADPGIAALQNRLQSAYPSEDIVQGVLELNACLARTMSQMAEVSVPGSGMDVLGENIAAAAEALDMTKAAFGHTLDDSVDGRQWLAGFNQRPLRVAEVRAPEINGVFSIDSSVTVDDEVTAFSSGDGKASGTLVSRLFPLGQPGTLGEGLYPFLYRILIPHTGAATQVAVKAITLDAYDIQPLDYDSSGTASEIFVITQGGVGTAAPTGAAQTSRWTSIVFDPPITSDAKLDGESFFFGFASRQPPTAKRAWILDGDDQGLSVQARSPGI
jgi:hypothetical protein